MATLQTARRLHLLLLLGVMLAISTGLVVWRTVTWDTNGVSPPQTGLVSLETPGENARSHYHQGRTEAAQGQWRQALDHYLKATELYPSYVAVYRATGLAYRQLQQWENAEEAYNRAIELDPKHARDHVKRGYIQIASGQPAQATESFELAITLDEHYAPAYHGLGDVYQAGRQWAEALSNYTLAINEDPHYLETYYHRAAVQVALRSYDMALADFDVVIQAQPHYANAYIGRSIVYWLLGRCTEAQHDLAAFMALSSGDFTDAKTSQIINDMRDKIAGCLTPPADAGGTVLHLFW